MVSRSVFKGEEEPETLNLSIKTLGAAEPFQARESL
jgi:hypothetical protein